MIKLKNKEILHIVQVLNIISQRASDMDSRWMLALYSEPLINIKNIINFEIDKLVNVDGIEKNGVKTISSDNKKYLELLECENDVDIKHIKLVQLAKFEPTIEELVFLKKIIK